MVSRHRSSATGALGAVLVLTVLLSACTWVKLTEQGKSVRVAQSTQVSGCEQLGEVSAHVLDKVAFVKRSRHKQAEELATLARNEAAGMGGNTIVPLSDIENGSRNFEVYRCQ
ncbi:MAG: DUF4156 domain-containing protein [Arenicellales bacterium]|jgi:hypothetical protein